MDKPVKNVFQDTIKLIREKKRFHKWQLPAMGALILPLLVFYF